MTEAGEFQSQRDAKRFFIEKVIAQALEEGSPLSAAQQWMLYFSESDPEFEVDSDQMDAFNREISDEEYEAKILGLILRRYRRDISLDRTARDRYRDAYAILDRGDHYVLALVDQALEGRLRRHAPALRVGLAILILVPALVAALMAIGLLWVGLTEASSAGDGLAALLGGLVLAGLSYYLIHLWRR